MAAPGRAAGLRRLGGALGQDGPSYWVQLFSQDIAWSHHSSPVGSAGRLTGPILQMWLLRLGQI